MFIKYDLRPFALCDLQIGAGLVSWCWTFGISSFLGFSRRVLLGVVLHKKFQILFSKNADFEPPVKLSPERKFEIWDKKEEENRTDTWNCYTLNKTDFQISSICVRFNLFIINEMVKDTKNHQTNFQLFLSLKTQNNISHCPCKRITKCELTTRSQF